MLPIFFCRCFVGEETGGWEVAFGSTLTPYLPVTGLTIRASAKELYVPGATEADRHGIFPDIQVPAEEALEYVLRELIN